MSRDFWAGRYQARQLTWDKGAASPGLVDFLAAESGLVRGTVAVPGCGTGHDVRAFAAAGFAATGFDFVPEAVELARAATAAAELTAEFRLADFLRDEPPQQYDWLFEHTLFCAIQPQERDAYVQAVTRWLPPAGHYLAVNYLDCGPEGPPWPTTRAEQWERFSPHFELIREWVPRSYANREGRERMFWWRRKAG